MILLDCSFDENQPKNKRQSLGKKNPAIKTKEKFDKAHMPGAEYFDLNSLLKKRKDKILPPDDQIKQHLQETMNVGKNDKIVCYDQGNGIGACAVACFLYFYGVKDVKFLNE